MSFKNHGIVRTVSLLLGFCLLIPFSIVSSTFAQIDAESAQVVQEVKVATYNIAAGIGSDGQFDLQRTAAAIRESGADIIGLQEVDVHWGSRSDFVDEIEYLTEELNMEAFFAPIYDMNPAQPDQPRRQFGVAVLSKYPILEATNHEIARLSTQDAEPEPKPAPGFPEVLVDVNGVKLWFYVTHLDYRGDPTIRQMQVADMLHVMSQGTNTILVGDLNARPEANELQPLFAMFTDAWEVAGGGDGFTFPANAPDRRIDYVLTSPGITAQLANVEQALASDHLLVTADVTLSNVSSDDLITVVERLQEDGEINSDSVAHSLEIHLTAVGVFEDKGLADKVIKHMEAFKQLLSYQKENQLISEKAYKVLLADVNSYTKQHSF